MDIEVVIRELRARCPLFSGRVAGAAQFKQLDQNSNFPVPAAYVIPMDDEPGPLRSQSGYVQDVREGIAIVVMLSNEDDERGQGSVSKALTTVRGQLWRCLLGWEMEDYGPFVYEGGQVLQLNRSRLYYQFEFSAEMTIVGELTRLGANFEDLPPLEGVDISVNYLDPGSGVPDAQVEHHLRVDLPAP